MTEEREVEYTLAQDCDDEVDMAALAALQRMHPRPFKLRFSAPRELGRSGLRPRLPLLLPNIVTGKFYSRWEREERERDDAIPTTVSEERVYRRSPKDIYKEPFLSSHEYGWYWVKGATWTRDNRKDARLWHAISDSHELKARAILLFHDNKLKGK